MFFSQPEIIAIIVLITALLVLIFIAGRKNGSSSNEKRWQHQLKFIKKDIADSSRSVIRGQVSEQIAPFLPGFPFSPSGCRFIGKPVDFIVFNELEDPDKCSIILVEVKTGSSSLNRNERAVKSAVKSGRVHYYEYRFNGADN
ncbi:MAG TPA: Holliday junction resolvase-like protein [Spirochaetota bacterium]|nr:Holliday junction resolvase-like protein [Spirochaetota bacterium]